MTRPGLGAGPSENIKSKKIHGHKTKQKIQQDKPKKKLTLVPNLKQSQKINCFFYKVEIHTFIFNISFKFCYLRWLIYDTQKNKCTEILVSNIRYRTYSCITITGYLTLPLSPLTSLSLYGVSASLWSLQIGPWGSTSLKRFNWAFGKEAMASSLNLHRLYCTVFSQCVCKDRVISTYTLRVERDILVIEPYRIVNTSVSLAIHQLHVAVDGHLTPVSPTPLNLRLGDPMFLLPVKPSLKVPSAALQVLQ